MTDDLLVAQEGPVLRLILNRPNKANALNPALVDALIGAIRERFMDRPSIAETEPVF